MLIRGLACDCEKQREHFNATETQRDSDGIEVSAAHCVSEKNDILTWVTL